MTRSAPQSAFNGGFLVPRRPVASVVVVAITGLAFAFATAVACGLTLH